MREYFRGDLGNAVRRTADCVLSGLLELLYPSNIYCCCCGDTIDPDMPYSLCSRCVRKITWTTEDLRGCGAGESGVGGENEENGECGEDAPHLFAEGYSCARYESRTKEILKRFKYGRKPWLAKPLGELMLERIAGKDLHPDLVTAVPMYRAKERRRGYNQAALLASEVARGLQAPCEPQLLLRTRNTGAMSLLNAEERRMNLSNAFQVNAKTAELIPGKSILLIDDIMTTGTTADECCAALLAAGAAEVRLLVFAAGEGK